VRKLTGTLSYATAMKLSVRDLLERKWLRQVDFLHTSHKVEGSSANLEARRALLRSLMRKLAALCMMDWLKRVHETPEVKHTEEEETESTRQRNRVRSLVARSRTGTLVLTCLWATFCRSQHDACT
jgi:hypothetical protein